MGKLPCSLIFRHLDILHWCPDGRSRPRHGVTRRPNSPRPRSLEALSLSIGSSPWPPGLGSLRPLCGTAATRLFALGAAALLMATALTGRVVFLALEGDVPKPWSWSVPSISSTRFFPLLSPWLSPWRKLRRDGRFTYAMPSASRPSSPAPTYSASTGSTVSRFNTSPR